MRLLRYVLVPWTALLVYAALSFFLGQNGLYARRHLEAERARLAENRNSLEATNRRLRLTKENLLTDDDALSVYARPLGFGRPNDAFVRVVGLSVAIGANVPQGQAIYSVDPHYVPVSTIRLVSLIFGGAALAFLLVGDSLRAREPDEGR